MMRFLLAIANAETRAQIKCILNAAFPACRSVESLQMDGWKFGSPAYDVALIDGQSNLPFAITSLADLAEKFPSQPVIMILDECDVELALQLMKAGAADVMLQEDTNE